MPDSRVTGVEDPRQTMTSPAAEIKPNPPKFRASRSKGRKPPKFTNGLLKRGHLRDVATSFPTCHDPSTREQTSHHQPLTKPRLAWPPSLQLFSPLEPYKLELPASSATSGRPVPLHSVFQLSFTVSPKPRRLTRPPIPVSRLFYPLSFASTIA